MKRPIPGILDPAELDAVRTTFGVTDIQVRRDHLISHALAAIASVGVDEVVFFGGTALCRTHLRGHRLSEDIDLVALTNRSGVAMRIGDSMTRQLRRSVGSPTFSPPLSQTRDAEPSAMEVAGLRVQIQLLDQIGYPRWPTEVVPVMQRYSDAPPAALRVLTPAAFAAAKLAAWHDRRAARDLYDLWALATHGMIDSEARTLFTRFGPATDPAAVSFYDHPTEAEWQASLRPQCQPQVTARDAALVVANAWQ